jgi:hypothetical protein
MSASQWRRRREIHLIFNIISRFRVIKSRRMRWARRVQHVGEMRSAYKMLAVKTQRGKNCKRGKEDNFKMVLGRA